MKNNGVWLSDLTSHRIDRGNHAGNWRNEWLGLAPYMIESGWALLEPSQFNAGLVQLHLRDSTALCKPVVTPNARLNNANLLVKLALTLAHVGLIDRLQRGCEINEHVAFVDARTQFGKPARRRRESAADDGLDITTCVGVGHDASRKLH